MLRYGTDLLVLGLGPILGEALQAAQIVSQQGHSVAVASLGGVKPLDHSFLKQMIGRYTHWCSVEEHGITGGLGSSLLEFLSNQRTASTHLTRIGVPICFSTSWGTKITRRKLGLDAEGLSHSFTSIISNS